MRALKYILLFLVCAGGLIWLAGRRPAYFVVGGETMGTYYRVKIRTRAQDADLSALIADELAAVNAEMSVFDPQSEISAVNRARAGEKIKLSPPLQKVLAKAAAVNKLSRGAFDPALGRLIDLWGFGPAPRQGLPSEEKIKEALAVSGFDKLRFSDDGAVLQKEYAETALNLSAIAKGYGVDRLAELLTTRGYRDFIVEIGGEVRASGTRTQNARGWNIALSAPAADAKHPAGVFALTDAAAATSGDYRNFIEIDGRKYAHTISPETGLPAQNRLASTTVFHHDCMTADALATALMAMGEKQALNFAEKNDLAVIFIIRGESGFSTVFSPAAKKIKETGQYDGRK